jgi:hypothetical protein
MTAPPLIPAACPPQLPPIPFNEAARAVTHERLRLLSIAYYISGVLGAAFVSFLLIHLCVFTAISFMPESVFQSKGSQHSTTQSSPQSVEKTPSSGPPVIIFRIVAGVIGVVILCGWILGGLTFYAGRCIAKRRNRTFVLVMAGVNCIWIPYGLLLGIATFLALESADAKSEYR